MRVIINRQVTLMSQRYLKLILIIPITLILASSCSENKTQSTNTGHEQIKPAKITFEDIKERDTLRVITAYNSFSYFIYRGTPMGYEYELVQRLADYLDLELKIIIAEDLDDVFKLLNKGKGDLIAYNLTVTMDRKKKVKFTDYHTTTQQVLVQKKPDNWRKMKIHQINNALIRNQINLIDKTIHVRENTSYFKRIHNLSEEIGGKIDIDTMPGNMQTEDIIKMVADNKIQYTIADKNIALINKNYYRDLDIKTPVSFPQQISWAVRKNNPVLLDTINAWIKQMKKKTDYYVIYNKYFKNIRAYTKRRSSEFYSKEGGKISKYDDIIKQYADKIKWDWRILASLIYQESQFKPTRKSWAGAVGLMQLMPETARDMGITNLTDPENSIKAGTKYLKQLQNFWIKRTADSSEALKFALASYNVGKGHLLDARRLCRKYGKNPEIWNDNVAKYILLKSEPKYYNDEVVKYGYCRGKEPFNYVKNILSRYETYKQVIENKKEPETAKTQKAENKSGG